MKIYDDKLAPNPRRVRIFMAEKGIAVPYEQVAIVKGEDWGELNRERALSALPWLDAGLAGKEFVAGVFFPSPTSRQCARSISGASGDSKFPRIAPTRRAGTNPLQPAPAPKLNAALAPIV